MLIINSLRFFHYSIKHVVKLLRDTAEMPCRQHAVPGYTEMENHVVFGLSHK